MPKTLAQSFNPEKAWPATGVLISPTPIDATPVLPKSTKRQKVSISLPVKTWVRLQDSAERHGLTAGEYLEKALVRASRGPWVTLSRTKRSHLSNKPLMKETSIKTTRETLRSARRRARKMGLKLWEFADWAVATYGFGKSPRKWKRE